MILGWFGILLGCVVWGGFRVSCALDLCGCCGINSWCDFGWVGLILGLVAHWVLWGCVHSFDLCGVWIYVLLRALWVWISILVYVGLYSVDSLVPPILVVVVWCGCCSI